MPVIHDSFIQSNYLENTQYFFFTPIVKKEIGERVFMFKAPSDWNNLPSNIRSLKFHILKIVCLLILN